MMTDEDIDFDIEELSKKIKRIFNRFGLSEYIIILLLLIMFIMIIVSQNDITACNQYWLSQINNTPTPLIIP